MARLREVAFRGTLCLLMLTLAATLLQGALPGTLTAEPGSAHAALGRALAGLHLEAVAAVAASLCGGLGALTVLLTVALRAGSGKSA